MSTITTNNSINETLDVLIIGAGFAGIYQLDRLRDLGHKVKIWESAPEAGGIWYWNCYPGARVDSVGPIYQFGTYKDLWKQWDYPVRYPGWRELRAYFAYVDRKLDFSKDTRYNTKVVGAEFDTKVNQWVVRAEDGATVRCTYIVACTGFGSKPYIPDFPGLNRYKGIKTHTGRWPQGGLNPTGKRVAVIGTGASGVQVIQDWSPRAGDLTVFQRTPNIALPMRQRAVDPEELAAEKKGYRELIEVTHNSFACFEFDFIPKNAVDATPEERAETYEEKWQEGGFMYWVGLYQDTLFSEEANRYAYEFWRDKVRARIKRPALWEKLAPTKQLHPFGCKRPSLEQCYYEQYNRDNVHLIDINENPIETFTERGIRTADGVEHEFDIIVLATGYDNCSGGLTAIDFHGTNGKTLKEKWSKGIDANLGIATAGFPNLMFVYGPQSPSGFCNGPTAAEVQGEMLVELVDKMLKDGKPRFESTKEADEKWSEHIAEAIAPTLFPKAKSWYMGYNIPGKKIQSINYPAGLPSYRKKWEESKAAGHPGFTFTRTTA